MLHRRRHPRSDQVVTAMKEREESISASKPRRRRRSKEERRVAKQNRERHKSRILGIMLLAEDALNENDYRESKLLFEEAAHFCDLAQETIEGEPS